MGRVMEGNDRHPAGNARHPYTRALIAACPRYDRPGQDLEPIPADVLATCRAEIASFDRAEAPMAELLTEARGVVVAYAGAA